MSKNELTKLKENIADKLDFRKFSTELIGKSQGSHRHYGETELEFICPFGNHDTDPSFNFNIDKGLWYCFGCGESGDWIDLYMELKSKKFWPAITELGQRVGVNVPGEMPDPSLTLQQYADAKGLDLELLKNLGLKKGDWYGDNALRVPYWDTDGELFRTRVRTSLFDVGNGRFKWDDDGESQTLYGLWKLPEYKDKVLLVEGESDCHTLWNVWENYPVLGIPGKSNLRNFKKDWIEYLQDFEKITILQENDAKDAVLSATQTLNDKTEAEICILDLPTDDVSDFYEIHQENFKELWSEAVENKEKFDFPQEGKGDLKLDVHQAKKRKKKKPGPKATYYKLIHDIEPEDLSGPPNFPIEAVKRGVFKKYLNWIEDNTEESVSFAFASLRNLIGLAIGRDYKVWYSGSLHSPMFFDVLIGRTSRTRKSSSIKTAYNLMRDAYKDEIQEFDTIWGIGSAQGVLAKLQGIAEEKNAPPKVVIREGEFEKLMHTITQPHTSNLKPFLIKAWDLEPKLENRTKNNPLKVKYPSVSIVASTVVENVKGYMTEDVKRGGFFNRFCWWVSTPQEPVPFRENERPNMLQKDLEEGVKTLIERGQRRESIDWNQDLTEDAKGFWIKFYRKWFESDGDDSFVSERTPALTVRHAALFALQHDGEKVTKEDLLRAKEITDYLEKTAHYALGQFEQGEISPGIRRVIKALKENGEMKASDISQKARSYFEGPNKGEALYRALDNLEKLGHLKSFER